MNNAPARVITPPGFLADPALCAVLAALPDARLVGGCVRDALLHRAVADIDLATPQPPDDVMAALRSAGLKAVATGLAHGTVTAVAGHRGFEVTTLRRDIATDGRHAVVEFTADWHADAARRDFTINAMSMTAHGAVFDYFTGLDDLAAGRLRFVGNPASRIAEDYLRVLRFFRFHARYARDAPDAAALAAIRDAVPGLTRLSVERVWSELKRILAGPRPADTLALMAECGVQAAVLPEATNAARLTRLAASAAPAEPVLRLAAMLAPETAAAVATRLKLSGAEAARLLAVLTATAPANDASDDDLRRALADTPRDALLGAAWLANRSDHLHARLAALPIPVFPLAGRDLATLGIPSGPAMGEALRTIRTWWLANGCLPDRAACQARAKAALIPGA